MTKICVFGSQSVLPVLLRVTLLLLLSALPYCSNDKKQSISYIDYVPNNPVIAYLEQTNLALRSWNIGLQTGVLGTSRNINPGYQANPPNWITVTSQTDCHALGVPLDLRGSDAECILDEGVVGICAVWSYKDGPNAGEIIDTTIIVEREALEDFTMNMELDNIKALLSHEIGHCLGLQHWGSLPDIDEDSDVEPGNSSDHQTHIMYPALIPSTPGMPSTPSTPKNEEITAIREIYDTDPMGCGDANPSGDCVNPSTLTNNDCGSATSAADHDAYEDFIPCYYTPVSDQVPPPRLFQPRFPTFHISASIGNAGMRAEVRPPGPPLEGETSVHIYEMRMDGKERLRRISPKGKKEIRVPWSTPSF